jgi:hypothetical protein
MAEAPVRRAYQVYLYAICFVAVLVLLFAGAQALFGIVRIALPEQTLAEQGFIDVIDGPPGNGFDPIDQERKRGVSDLLENGIVAGLAGALFAFHWRRATRLRGELEAAGLSTSEDVGQPSPPGGG